MLTACSQGQSDSEGIIDRPDFHSSTGVFDIDALEALGRVGGQEVSPDGTKILYGVSYESLEENASNRDLYVMDIDGKNPTRITSTPKSESSAVWIDGGKRIAFLYPDDNKTPQLWVMNADGSARTKVTDLEKGLEGFLFSPDQSKVLLISTVKYAQKAEDIYPDLPKATGRVIDDLMYKHWDQWVEEIPHPFIADFANDKIDNITDILADEPDYESPMRPFGGVESFAWTPDSKQIVYTCRKKKGLEYAISTNSDLFLYTLEDKSVKNLTEGMMGYDTMPVFSPDGSKMAWLSMERDGYEADKNRLFVMDMASGEKTDLTANWDYTIENFAWAKDGKSIWFLAYYQGVEPIFNIDLATAQVKKFAEGMCDFSSLAVAGDNHLIATAHSMLRRDEMYDVTEAGF